MTDKQKRDAESEKGYQSFSNVYSDAHSEGKKEGWNEAIDAVEELMTDGGWLYDRDGNVLLGLIQKLRK